MKLFPSQEPYTRTRYEREVAATHAFEIIDECVEKAVGWAAMYRQQMKWLEKETLNLSLQEAPQITLDLDSGISLAKDLMDRDLDKELLDTSLLPARPIRRRIALHLSARPQQLQC